jgi:hypothetical protein
MKKLLTEWRKYLNESEVKHSGIIKLKLNPDVTHKVLELQDSIKDEDAVKLAEKALHVTLVHQSFMEPYRKQLKKMELPEAPEPRLDEEKGIIIKEAGDKKSWAIELENQDEMREYVRRLMESLGDQSTNPEPERKFHITLANLTGSPQDSVR